MKTRIISAAVGVALFILIFCFYETIVLNIAVAVFCSIMIYEIFKATKLIEKSVFAFLVCEFFCVLCSFLKISKIKNLNSIYLICYGAVFLLILFKYYEKVKIENLVFTFSFSMFLTLAMNLILEFRNHFGLVGMYYNLLLFAIAWICDTGAYFTGLKFGRRKLAPKISPKKTVEGALGGIFLNLTLTLILNLIYFKCANYFGRINWISLISILFIGSLCAIIGDLSMSVVKRSYEIKDFGKIMQGHGGILDRFDSWIFVCIVAYPLILHYPIIM